MAGTPEDSSNEFLCVGDALKFFSSEEEESMSSSECRRCLQRLTSGCTKLLHIDWVSLKHSQSKIALKMSTAWTSLLMIFPSIKALDCSGTCSHHLTFTFKIKNVQKPFTRARLLSTVKCLYDPVGFLAPVTVWWLILRELTMQAEDWNLPLLTDKKVE